MIRRVSGAQSIQARDISMSFDPSPAERACARKDCAKTPYISTRRVQTRARRVLFGVQNSAANMRV